MLNLFLIYLIPTCRPITFPNAAAARVWSPVIISNLICVLLHFLIIRATPGLGGSQIPTIPRRVKVLSGWKYLVLSDEYEADLGEKNPDVPYL